MKSSSVGISPVATRTHWRLLSLVLRCVALCAVLDALVLHSHFLTLHSDAATVVRQMSAHRLRDSFVPRSLQLSGAPSCAVVGNAELTADRAAEIDANDVVIRCNRPLAVSGAGDKTTHRFVNVAFLADADLFRDRADETIVTHTTRANRSAEHVAIDRFCGQVAACAEIGDELVDLTSELLGLAEQSHPRTGVLAVVASVAMGCRLPVLLFRFGPNDTIVRDAIDPQHRHEFEREEALLRELESGGVAERR